MLSGEGALDTLARARTLEGRGLPVLHVEVGEPDYPVAPHITEAAVKALRDGSVRYGPPAGLASLREAIASSLYARDCRVYPDQVFVTPGAKSALFYAVLSTVEPGDEVLVPDPGFPAYPSVVRFAGGAPRPYGFRRRPDGSDAIDLDALSAAISPRTKVLILNAPGNPTGVTLDATDRVRLSALAARAGLIVIADECYGRLLLDTDADAVSIHGAEGMAERTIVVDGFSKSYGMTGWRLGFAVVPPVLAPSFATLMVNGHTCVAEFTQRAGIAALHGPQSWLSAYRRQLRRRRDRAVHQLRAIDGIECSIPRGAFYLFPDCSAALESIGWRSGKLAEELLTRFHVAALDGACFGARGAGHLRLSLAAGDDVLAEAIARLGKCLSEARAGRVREVAPCSA